MYIPIQTNKPSIEIDEELMLDLKGIKKLRMWTFLLSEPEIKYFVTLILKSLV